MTIRGAAAFLADAPRRLEDRASRIDAAAGHGLAERLFNQPLQSRIANTTIMVIEFH